MHDQILHLVEEKLVGNFHTDIRLSSFRGDVVAVKKLCICVAYTTFLAEQHCGLLSAKAVMSFK